MVFAEKACEAIVGSGSVPATFPGTFGILGAGWAEVSFLALLFSLFMLAVIYMAAAFFRNQQLLAWTKFELFQILGTAVIFVFTLAVVTGMCSFSLEFLFPPGSEMHGLNMYQVAESYFAKLEYVGQLLFAYMMYVVKVINFLTRVQWISNPMGLGMTDSPLEGIGQLNSVFFYMVSGFVTSYLLLHFQMRIMDYMAVASLFYLFPFGIFFRSFEPTRGFGGALIGISIAFFLFYPLTIAFNYYLIWDPFYNPSHGMQQSLSQGIENADQKLDPSQKSLDPTELRDTGLQQIGDRQGSEGMIGGIATGAIFILQPAMLYFMAAVALPILNFIVLVEITRALTKFLGEEIDVSNLTRLI